MNRRFARLQIKIETFADGDCQVPALQLTDDFRRAGRVDQQTWKKAWSSWGWKNGDNVTQGAREAARVEPQLNTDFPPGRFSFSVLSDLQSQRQRLLENAVGCLREGGEENAG